MTLKEFSKKYDIPYHLVYEVSYKVPYYLTEHSYREYHEDLLFKAVAGLLIRRVDKNREIVKEQIEMLRRLNERSPLKKKMPTIEEEVDDI